MEGTSVREKFLEGMSRAATFVSVVTTDGEAGRYGVTVSSMTSVSADGMAPSLLVCIHRLSPAATAILRNRLFCANLLNENQQEISDVFSGRKKDEHQRRFDDIAWEPGKERQPMLKGATAAFICNLRTSLLWETHYIMVGEVIDVCLDEIPHALLYGQRAYRKAVGLE